MNMKLMVGLVVGVVMVAAGAYWLLGNGGATNISGTQDEAAESMSARFAALVNAGQSLQCTFQYDDGETISHGTVYMTAGAERIRGDFEITDSAIGPMEMHLIRDGGYNHLWGSILPQGIKVAVENHEALFDGSDDSPVDENTEYECRPWGVDESRFALPTGVTFQDMTALQQNFDISGSAGGSADVKVQQCAACAMIPDADMAAECRLALRCE